MSDLTAIAYITAEKYGNDIINAIFAVATTAEDSEFEAAKIATDEDISRLKTYPATAGLICKVWAEGGNISWAVVNGIACTNEEAEAHYSA